MKTIGSYEAKTHLPMFLKEVANGEEIMITKHGVAVAYLVPPQSKQKPNPMRVIEELRIFRKKQSLKGLAIKDMIKEGRKY